MLKMSSTLGDKNMGSSFARRLRCILKIMTVIQKTLFLAAGQPKSVFV